MIDKEWLSLLTLILAVIAIIYMVTVGLIYLILFLIASSRIKKERFLNQEEYVEELASNKDTFPVSVLIPAYNEEVGIYTTVRSMLGLNYPQYEIIVIDDGSKDNTSGKVIEEFKMTEIDVALRKYFDTKDVTKAYQSTVHPNIFLLRKENGGKADALNAGINFSRYPYFAAVDGDCILDHDALLKVMKPIIDSNGLVTVTGGTVRIANGSTITRSQVEKIALPKGPIVLMQIIEYFRAFLIGRLGLSRLNILLIISGAFGVFEKKRVVKVGGYNTKTVGEDMELIVRMHRSIKEEKSNQRVEYIQDPVCWTEAPDSAAVLRSQRKRWQRGLAETIWLHKKMLFNPKYKGIGLFSMPYYLIVELLSVIFELVGYVVIMSGLLFSFVSLDIVIVMFIVTVFYGSLLSSLAVLLEEWTYHKYPDTKSLIVLFFWALTESFWYRPLMVWWRFSGLIQSLTKKADWGNMKRKGISTD
ncbi:glycosyltransferase family 2 protein [Salipaludibacillus agaradhaerens]|uniref:Glycosyltransferase family 2 protein n=1 Tax=Salipaludibacillus agaradhaerens TaxID=76935 RepID=A0A9Q4B5E8_SALAG|nr:glycosyltransferase [Salipaludibacillus agaradhaerens]MCR6098668.1 glycosyltransferase family 2 protein [Salipaludibacillus agaradhaerens]MCR6115675.1 glycosyltransferase family 2 protein [Salipaludibacillus agaradhaerens]